MLIENESNWSTEDLVALVEAVTGKESFKLAPEIGPDTLILFKTSRKRKGGRGFSARRQAPPPAHSRWAYKTHSKTVFIEIGSAKRLQMGVLDRMANIKSPNCQQDMAAENVVKLATVIHTTLCCFSHRRADLSWAATMSMRTRSKTTKSKLAVKKKIDKIKENRDKYTRWYEQALADCDRQIRELKDRMRKL
jgi:hypothetical protein